MKPKQLVWLGIVLLLGLAFFGVCLIIKSSDNLATGRGWEPGAIYKLPQEPGAYVLWEEKRVIHVGSTGNLHQRISTHEKKKQMTSFDWY